MSKKKNKKIISIICAGLLLVNTTATAFAAETKEATEKEENVYITLNADGSVKNVYVVNTFAGGDIVDYGDYSSVKILDTTDEIFQNGDEITFSTSAEKVSYQGDMDSSTKIPWRISIRYFLDGKEYDADELAGASGALEIQLSVIKNSACSGSFYDDYALQISFTLDTDLCENISAVDATVANVGSDKQLTYTVLPGAGIETTITADVTDFEMDAVSINGIQMNLNIEVDDEELLEQITELQDAIGAIDDGAGEVQDGVSELQESVNDELASGVSELQNGAIQLSDGAAALVDGGQSVSSGAASVAEGAAELDTGIQALNSGISELQAGLDTLDTLLQEKLAAFNTQSANLTEASAQMDAVLEQLQGMLEDPTVSDELKSAISTLIATYSTLESNLDAYTASVSELLTGYNQISDGAASLAAGSTALVSGSNSLYAGTAELLNGITELYNATGTLTNGAGELSDGVAELLAGIATLNDGTSELKNGTSELRSETEGMDTEIEEQIDELLNSFTGSGDVTSFVSEKNTNVTAVQFVMQTDAIQVADVETEEEVEEELTLWEKLLNLFGVE